MTPALSVSVHVEADRTRLALEGELDAATVAIVQDALAGAWRQPVRCVELDCTGLTFIDSTGIRTFITAHLAASESGRRFVVTRLQKGPRRILEICGVLDALTEGG